MEKGSKDLQKMLNLVEQLKSTRAKVCKINYERRKLVSRLDKEQNSLSNEEKAIFLGRLREVEPQLFSDPERIEFSDPRGDGASQQQASLHTGGGNNREEGKVTRPITAHGYQQR